MITIGIELNHVIRNINKQIIKYYTKEYAKDVDPDELNDKTNVLDTFARFDSKYAKNNFIYIDYPFEIFGSSVPMDKNLPRDINNWMAEMTDREDETFRVIYYSLNEEALTIQSTFFFLSKIGTRVREVLFPQSIDEIWNHCDVVITANDEVLESKPQGKQSVKVLGNGNQDSDVECDFKYDSMTSIIEDGEFLNKVIENYKKE